MADRWLFAGLDLGQVRVQAGAPATSTTSGRFNATYSDHCVNFDSTNRGIIDFINSSGASDAAVTGEKLYFHTELYFDGHSTVGNHLELLDGSDQPWLAIRQTSIGVYGLHYNSGTGGSPTWTLVTGASSAVADGRKTVDVWITLGSPHTAGWAVSNAQIGEHTFTQASLTSLDAALFRSSTTTNDNGISEVMASVGISTVGGHVFYGKPTGAGSNTAQSSGTYADIDDVGIDDTNSISFTSASLRATFAYSNLPTLGATEQLGDIFLVTRGKNDGAAPTNLKPVRRDSGGTDNVGSSFSGISSAYQSFTTRYSGITESEYNASEFGAESET